MADDTVRASIVLEGLSQFQSDMDTAASAGVQATEKLGAGFQQVSVKTDAAMSKMVESAEKSSVGIRGAFAEINEAAEGLEASFKALGEVFLIGAAIEVGHKLIEMDGAANELEVQLLHLSERTGVSVETLNGLRGAAALVDVPMAQLGKGIQTLERQMTEAERGTKAAVEAFGTFGISIDEIAGKNPHEIFLTLADAMEHTRDSSEKTAAAMTLLGARNAALIPLLDQGRAGILDLESAFNTLNPISHAQAEEADQLHRSWLAVKTVGEAFGHSLGSFITPALEALNTHIAATIIGLEAIAAGFAKAANAALHGHFSEAGADISSIHANAMKQMTAVNTVVGAESKQEGTGGNEPIVTDKGSAAAARKAAAAAKKAADEQFQLFVDEQRLEIAEADNNAIAKIGAMMQVVEKAKELFGEQSKQYRAALVEEQQAVNQFTAEQTRQQLAAMELDRQVGADAIRQAQEVAKQKAALADVNATKTGKTDNGAVEVAQQQALENQLHQIELAALNQELALDNLKVPQQQKINAEIEKEQRRHVLAMGQLAIQGAQTEQKAVQQLDKTWAAAQGEFDHMIESLRGGTKGIESFFEELALKIAESIAGDAIRAAFDAQFALQKLAQLHSAEQAGAAAWASAAAIPYVGWLLAPVAAAAAFAGAMAFEHGGFVPGSGPVPAILHGGEFVMPAPMVRSMNFSQDSPAVMASRSGGTQEQGPAGHTVHIHQGNVNAMDRAGVERVMLRNNGAIVAAVAKGIRNGRKFGS